MSQKTRQDDLADKLLKDFHGNEIIIDKTITSLPIIEESCVNHFKTLLTSENKFIRIAIEGGGCSGFQYAFYIDSWEQTSTDIILNNNPLVLIDKESVNYMKGAIIKLEKSPFNTRVYVENPGAKSSCGCGSSFNYEL